ncbi:MAG: hypothetical protein EHM58_09805 [Ignavibacteriae bacterium]|nr:MAG: hypothetical protein EHM58_09805 [Ignavibacteriota bacterium]
MSGKELFEEENRYKNEYSDDNFDILDSIQNAPDEDFDDSSRLDEKNEYTDDNDLNIDELDEDFDDEDDDDMF